MKIRTSILLTVAFAGFLASSFGQTVTWNGTTSNWATTTNWSSGALPTSSETVLFSNSGTTGSVSLSANRTVGGFSMTRNSSVVIITMNPDNLTVNGNLTTLAGSQNLTFRNGGFLSVGGNMTVASQVLFGSRGNSGLNALIGGVSVAGTTSLSSTLEFTNFSTTVNLGALATSTGAILNLTSGISPNGTTDGNTNLITVTSLSGTAGTIQANKAGTTGHLSVSGTSNGTYGGTIVNGLGTVRLTKSGNSALTLSGNNTYTGATTVTAGTLILSGSGNFASATLGFGVTNSSSGILQVDNTAFAFTGTMNLTLSTVSASSGSWNLFSGSAFGSGDINLAGLTSDIVGLTFTQTANVWSGALSGRTWTFTEATGQLSVVPEPSTWVLLALGLTALVVFRRRIQHR